MKLQSILVHVGDVCLKDLEHVVSDLKDKSFFAPSGPASPSSEANPYAAGRRSNKVSCPAPCFLQLCVGVMYFIIMSQLCGLG